MVVLYGLFRNGNWFVLITVGSCRFLAIVVHSLRIILPQIMSYVSFAVDIWNILFDDVFLPRRKWNKLEYFFVFFLRTHEVSVFFYHVQTVEKMKILN